MPGQLRAATNWPPSDRTLLRRSAWAQAQTFGYVLGSHTPMMPRSGAWAKFPTGSDVQTSEKMPPWESHPWMGVAHGVQEAYKPARRLLTACAMVPASTS